MQKHGANSRRSARKRKTSQSWDEFTQFDEDYVDNTYLPPKRSTRLHQTSISETHDQCHKILSDLMNHKYAWPFKVPVDPIALSIPDYFEKIKNPMDFGTIQKKLSDGEYETAADFADDVRLVFSNCWTYNAPGSDIHLMGTTLSTQFERQFRNLKPKQQKTSPKNEITEMQNVIADLRSEHQKLLNELTKLVKGPVKPVANVTKNNKKKVKKQKVKVEAECFTVKQKKELTEKINKLTPEDLQGMVELLSSEIPEDQRQNGELEIDLEKLSIPTLKKLDNYVDGCLTRHNISITSHGSKADDSSSSDSDSSSSDSSDSDSEPENNLVGGKENETSA